MNRKTEAMIEQIRRLHSEGRSIKMIAKALTVSRNTVRRHLREQGAEVRPESSAVTRAALSTLAIDWKTVAREIALGRPIKRIYEDLEPPVSYAHFSRLAKAHRPPSPPTTAIRLHHEPAQKTQVDYADGIPITDARTGKTTKTQFFCGVLPHSAFTFGEFTASQKTADFIGSHERMWAYFGGITPYVVLDNLKSGVTKAHRYDPDVNPVYCDYGNHAGFAALPARVRTPRDKAAVEAAIGVIQRDFFDKHRTSKFYSLAELNAAFRRYLDDFNGRVMVDYGVSRNERFALEKLHLRPLPLSRNELYEWKTAKVHPDCCIELKRSVYSVPYRYAHQTVRVKYSNQMVLILDEATCETLAAHARQAPFKNSILPEHLPPTKTQLASFDVRRVQKFADSIGGDTRSYVNWQLESEVDHPLRALRRLLGLMRFFEASIGVTKEAMEYAARQASTYQRRDLAFFRGCALAFRPVGAEHLRLVSPPTRRVSDIHVRPPEGE